MNSKHEITIDGHSANTIAFTGFASLLFYRDYGHITKADYIRLRKVWRSQWKGNVKKVEREALQFHKQALSKQKSKQKDL